MATGDLVLFLNDDTVVEPGALHALVDALLDHPTWGACQAKLLLMHDPDAPRYCRLFLTATGFLVHRGARGPELNYVRSDEVFAAKGAALIVRRRALDEIGVFDPDYFAYFEDCDLCWRLWLAGWAVGFAADARIRHRLGATASDVEAGVIQFHSFKNRICSHPQELRTTTARVDASPSPRSVSRACGRGSAFEAGPGSRRRSSGRSPGTHGHSHDVPKEGTDPAQPPHQ